MASCRILHNCGPRIDLQPRTDPADPAGSALAAGSILRPY